MLPLNTATRIGLSILLLLAGVVALHLGASVFMPMFVALLLATVLGPAAVSLHETFKMRWGVACMTVVATLVLINLLLVAIFSANVTVMVTKMSDEKQILEIYNWKLRPKLEKVWPVELDPDVFPKDAKDIRSIGALRYFIDAAPDYFRKTARVTADWSWQVILTLFITFFVLLEGKMLAKRVVAIFGPTPEIQGKATEVLFEMAKQVRNYLVWRTLINLGLAIVMGILYQMFGLTQAWNWAILLAVLNYVPYLGPLLAIVPPFLDAFIFVDPAAAIVLTILYIVVIVLEGYLVVPLVMGRSMDLNATTVMLGCLFWDLVWGMTGLFLAMPIMAGLKAILFHVPEWRPWANLMSAEEHPLENPPAPPAG
ncbi:MAG: AI-2E family transporter [Gemmataceae bacterium]|nr:AI-2E family transporter [Gemmataceae bacterium]